MFRKTLNCFILFLVFLLTCCQKGNQDHTVNTLKLNFQEGDLPSLHPHDLIIYLRGISASKVLFEGLTRIDEQGKAQLAGAKSVSISNDRLKYTFTLRDNAWSNGTPVTAHQYENGWKEVLSPLSPCSRADLLYLIKNGQEAKKGKVPLDAIGVKAIDEKTLQVELAYPSPYFLELLAQPICAPLLNPKARPQTEFNGPFQVASWEKNVSLRLKPNPHFWNRSQVSIKQIEFSMISDISTAYSLYEKEKLDWMGVPLCPLSTDLIHHIKKAGHLKSHPIERAFWIFLNTQHPGLSNPSIRRALSAALDRKAITQHILVGGNPLLKPIPTALLASAAALLPENDTDAKKHFDQGLQELGLTPSTFPSLIISYSQQSNRKQFAEYLQERWGKTFGINIQLDSQEWNVLRTNLEKGLYQICGGFEAAYYSDPLELLDRLASLNPCNFPKWTDANYTKKIQQATHESNSDKRADLLAEAEQILLDQVPLIPVCSDCFLFTHIPNLKHYAFDSVGAIDFSYATF
jgi:oligopeptide transport system substrate-binding protein